jgi:hypothetical protein
MECANLELKCTTGVRFVMGLAMKLGDEATMKGAVGQHSCECVTTTLTLCKAEIPEKPHH